MAFHLLVRVGGVIAGAVAGVRRTLAILAAETRQRFGVIRRLRRENFDGPLAPEARIEGAIDLAHSAAADEIDDLVRPQSRSARESRARSMDESRCVGDFALRIAQLR